MQFACKTNRGVKDATATLFHYLYKHLKAQKLINSRLIYWLSFAFNTIQPLLLANKLLSIFNRDCFALLGGFSWRVGPSGSGSMMPCHSSAHRCVLSPLLYPLYHDWRSQYSDRHILTFGDYIVIISLLRDGETSRGPVVDEFVHWRDDRFLRQKTTKTKDMAIDLRGSASLPPSQTVVKGQGVDKVESYKYFRHIH